MSENAKMSADKKEQDHFFGSAKTVAALTMLSRILGMIRDIVIIPIGSRVLADRFWLAFSIPNLFRRLFGEGALSAAFIPVFTEASEQGGVEKARKLVANVGGILALVLVCVLVLVEIGLFLAYVCMDIDRDSAFCLQMVGLLMPFMVTICLLALGSAALNCNGHFAYPAFAPVILNIFLIIGAAWVAPYYSTESETHFCIIGISLLVAGVVQLVCVVWLLRKCNMIAFPFLSPLMPETRKIASLMLPMMIPLGAIQITAFLDRYLALLFTEIGSAPLEPGIVRCLYPASRLYMLPMGILAMPIATVVFPLLGRYASRGDKKGLRDTTTRALRLCLFLSIPAAAALILTASRTVNLLFERGEFGPDDTRRTAFIIQMYSIGLWAYFFNHVLNRAFFAVKQPRSPVIVALVLAPVNIVFVVIGIHTQLKGGGIGVATAITQSINAIVLIILLRKMWGQMGFRQLAFSLIRTCVATAGAIVVAMAVLEFLPGFIQGVIDGGFGKGVVLISTIVVIGIVYIVLSILLQAPELKELFRRGTAGDQGLA